MTELINKPWNYILYKEETTRYVLSVVCGRVATFSLNSPLSEAEVEVYMPEGEHYINSLAAQLQYSPSSYRNRHIEIGINKR